MKASLRRRAYLVAGCLVLMILPASVFAYTSSFVRVTGGASSGAGNVTITIESFGSLVAKGLPSAMTVYPVNSSIPMGTSVPGTATILRNDIDTALPADFMVMQPEPDVVQIVRLSGTFTRTVNTSAVPGQTVAEANSPLPAVGPVGLAALASLLALSGAAWAWRRRTA